MLDALERIGSERAPGTAVDLACGAGRHALELARRGWRTQAWDLSEVALERCAERAHAAELAVTTRAIDLAGPETTRIGNAFDLAVVVDFLEPSLFPALAALVRPQGWLIYATFAPDWPGEKPSRRFRIAAAELRARLPEFDPLIECETAGRSGLLARRRV